ncbi:tetratricopeptide repeat protein [Synechococcus sp. 7002]|uniref:tetratricopeptide repeat protein n=1 Tax=Synechococcus sp. 7002 TaxID=1938862 RepID=UPI000A2ABEC2|nr:tetratricopeptide repeat protein [Synechococcus sp. 7002]SMQ83499.1 Tetratricopeptide repeat-containing protein [Synechococcus sp. 7002]
MVKKAIFSLSGSGPNTHRRPSPLTDADFEFLLAQLLQGISRGWQPDRLEVFIADLGIRGKVTAWEAWLERYSTQILAQAQPPQQQQIGTRLLYISNAFKNSPKLQRFARAFGDTGQQLVTGRGKITIEIWEYDGADQLAELETTPENTPVPEYSQEASPETVEPVVTPEVETAAEPLSEMPETINPEEPETPIQEMPEETTQEITETTTEGTPQTIESLFQAGLTKADQGDFVGAIADWDQVIEINPTISAVWHNRGSALGRLKQYDQALESLKQAILLAPDNVLIWRDHSYVLMALEQWQAALKSWNTTIELQEDLTEAWYQRGLTLEQLNKLENAQINYRRVLHLVPDFVQARERLEAIEAVLNAPSSPLPTDPWAE